MSEAVGEALERFEIQVPDAVLLDLDERLSRTRFPDQIDGTGWDQGVPTAYLRELVDYWRHDYDWRSEETRLNRFAHFRTRIDGQSIHFVHAPSPHRDALPLLLVHGWPGSIVEFLEVIPLLTDPPSGDPSDAFHVVAPSLPGYAFSGPTTAPGWDTGRIARAFVELMRRLGHERFAVQGGDWGAQVATRIGAIDPPACVAIHLNMPIAGRPADPPPLTDQEQAVLAATARFQREESAYAVEQGTKPQTLGAALSDSPAGLLAWVVEKFREWSDCGGRPEAAFSRRDLITNVMLYWVTGTITSSMRLYWEHRHEDSTATGYVTVPTGVACYPKEILRFPRSWVERRYHVTHWVEMPRGGHFAAMEEPALFAEDLRTFFRTVR